MKYNQRVFCRLLKKIVRKRDASHNKMSLGTAESGRFSLAPGLRSTLSRVLEKVLGTGTW